MYVHPANLNNFETANFGKTNVSAYLEEEVQTRTLQTANPAP
jgi:hypothetical protein